MIQKISNVLSGGDFWATNVDGSTQIKYPSETDTYVDFTNVPYGDYAYFAYIDMDTATTPTATPIKLISGTGYEIRDVSDGYCTVRLNFSSAVTADQENATFLLRVIR